MSSPVKFNIDHYSAVRDAKRADGTNSKCYCPPLKQFVDAQTGVIRNHPLEGMKARDIEDKSLWTIQSVCAHWWKGYYYFILLTHDETKTSTSFNLNINSYLDYFDDMANIKRFEIKSGNRWVDALGFCNLYL